MWILNKVIKLCSIGLSYSQESYNIIQLDLLKDPWPNSRCQKRGIITNNKICNRNFSIITTVIRIVKTAIEMSHAVWFSIKQLSGLFLKSHIGNKEGSREWKPVFCI